MNRATLNKTKWEGKQLAMTASHPHMRKLPFPVQRLIGREARLAVGLEQKPWPIPPIGDDAKCKCKFYVSYLLPCRLPSARAHATRGALHRMMQWDDGLTPSRGVRC